MGEGLAPGGVGAAAAFQRGSPTQPREVAKVALVADAGWTIRQYLIRRPGSAIDPSRLAFCIYHPGADQDYTVLCWWDNVNELITRVWVSPYGEEAWRAAETSASFCVWDFAVLSAERDAYVRRVLAGASPSLEQHRTEWPEDTLLEANGALRVIAGRAEWRDALRTRAD